MGRLSPRRGRAEGAPWRCTAALSRAFPALLSHPSGVCADEILWREIRERGPIPGSGRYSQLQYGSDNSESLMCTRYCVRLS